MDREKDSSLNPSLLLFPNISNVGKRKEGQGVKAHGGGTLPIHSFTQRAQLVPTGLGSASTERRPRVVYPAEARRTAAGREVALALGRLGRPGSPERCSPAAPIPLPGGREFEARPLGNEWRRSWQEALGQGEASTGSGAARRERGNPAAGGGWRVPRGAGPAGRE